MQAIRTKYKGPTNSNGSRFIVTCDAKRIVVHYDHALSVEENHVTAARVLRDKLGWTETMHSGRIASGEYAHVFSL